MHAVGYNLFAGKATVRAEVADFCSTFSSMLLQLELVLVQQTVQHLKTDIISRAHSRTHGGSSLHVCLLLGGSMAGS